MIETLLTSRLKTVAANVYPNVAPTNYKVPCVVYQRIETESMRDITEDEQSEAFVTFIISISSPIFGEAKTLARSVRNSLKAWQDDDVQAVAWINEHAIVDNSTDVTLHRVLLFFKFFYNEE